MRFSVILIGQIYFVLSYPPPTAVLFSSLYRDLHTFMFYVSCSGLELKATDVGFMILEQKPTSEVFNIHNMTSRNMEYKSLTIYHWICSQHRCSLAPDWMSAHNHRINFCNESQIDALLHSECLWVETSSGLMMNSSREDASISSYHSSNYGALEWPQPRWCVHVQPPLSHSKNLSSPSHNKQIMWGNFTVRCSLVFGLKKHGKKCVLD